MAGPGIGVWVKVKNKSGRMTARVIANKYGGGEYSQGQVITQSEFNEYRQQRAEMKAQEGGGGSGENKKDQSIETRRVTGAQSKAAAEFNVVDVKEIVSPRNSSEFSEKRINDLADSILENQGLVKPIVVRQTGIDSFEVIDGHLEYYAAARARQINPRAGEMVNTFVVSGKNAKAVQEQLGIIRAESNRQPKGQTTASSQQSTSRSSRPTNDFATVDVKNISSTVNASQFSAGAVDRLANSIIQNGGLYKPVVLRQTGMENFEVISGHLEYHAAARARQINPRAAEMVNSFVVSNSGVRSIEKQLRLLD